MPGGRRDEPIYLPLGFLRLDCCYPVQPVILSIFSSEPTRESADLSPVEPFDSANAAP